MSPTDLHRSLTELDQLDEILSWQEERTVSRRLTVQYDRVVYLLEPTELAKDLQRKRVQVKQADIVSNKRLSSVLQHVKEQQKVKSIQRSKSAPQRRGQKRICKETYRKVNSAAMSVE